MSGADRTAIRAAAKAALQAAPRFAGFSNISAWAQSVSAKDLPAWAVATPREAKDRQGQAVAQQDLTLIVVIKRVGEDDIEDVLDADSTAVEDAITAALRDESQDCDLAQTEMKVDGDGAQRVGTLTMLFNVTYWVDDPA